MGMNPRKPTSINQFYNALHSHFSSSQRQTPIRRRFRGLAQPQLLHGSSLPLSSLFCSSPYCTFRAPYCQISCFLSHPTSLSFLQESRLLNNGALFDCNVGFKGSFGLFDFVGLRKDLILRPRGVCSFGGSEDGGDLDEGESGSVESKKLKNVALFDCNVGFKGSFGLSSLVGLRKDLIFRRRGFCSVGDSEDCSDFDEGEGEGVESEKSEVDLREVERVCKVIEELFALDRNMEAVLDECGIELSHGLVVEVLERFKHARKPAFRFFCWAGNQEGFVHDSRTYNVMMRILGKTRQFETMVSLLEEMGEKGVLNIETFQIAIQAFAASQERRKAVAMFELMKKYKFKVDVDTINCLLDALGRAKLGKEAQLLFGKLEETFTPNLQTYTVLLNGWCKVKNIMEAGRVWNEMIDKGIKPDVVAHNTMLEGLLRDKKVSDAIKLFGVMKTKGPAPNVRSYTIMIRDLCKQKKMDRAVEYYEEMLDHDCKPDAAVYTCLITGYGNMKKMDKVYGLLKEMKEKGCPPDGQMYNALIKLMTNRKMSDDAVRIYKKMVQSGIQPTIHTYNMMMKSFFQTRNFDMGFAAWEEMNQNGCCPDDNSYIVLIGGLIRQGRSVEACKYLEEMIEKGMKAPQIDYNKFTADFSRAGKPNILEELAEKMKFSGKLEVSNFFSRCAEMKKGGGLRSKVF